MKTIKELQESRKKCRFKECCVCTVNLNHIRVLNDVLKLIDELECGDIIAKEYLKSKIQGERK